MKTTFFKFCKHCNTETEHYACGHCIKCMLAYYQVHRNEKLVYYKNYHRTDLNDNGITKVSIRGRSQYILFKKRRHTRLENYEIHHCFGYDDPSKFIYIPKTLHLQIHQRLRDKNISAEDAHFEQIKDLINECKEYTYISI